MRSRCIARSMPPPPPFPARTSNHLRPVTRTSQEKPDDDNKNSGTVFLSFSSTKSGSRRRNNCPSSHRRSSTCDSGISRTHARVSSSKKPSNHIRYILQTPVKQHHRHDPKKKGATRVLETLGLLKTKASAISTIQHRHNTQPSRTQLKEQPAYTRSPSPKLTIKGRQRPR